MKHTEKLDIILKKLYEFRFDGKDYSIQEILSSVGITATREEVYSLTNRLDSEGLVDMTATKDSITAEISSRGIEYCEGDSFTYSGRAIINNNYDIKIENSPGANIINQSNNVTIHTEIQNIKNVLDKIKETLEKDTTVASIKKAKIKDSIDEIENNLKAGKIPKFGIESLVGLAGDISSIGSLILSLIQFISN